MALIHYDLRGVPDLPWDEDGDQPSRFPADLGDGPLTGEDLADELAIFRLYSVEMLDQIPPTRWLIRGLLAEEELSVLYGKGDTFKSFTAIGWACAVAASGRPVVYIAAEGTKGIKLRVRAWMKENGVARLPNFTLLPTNVNLHEPRDVTAYIEALQGQFREGVHPALVIVDTLARNFVGGSESSPQDMGLFVEGCEQIRRQLRTAVLVIHHTDKADNAERGTESLRNASFAMFKTSDKRKQTILLTCDRMKEAEPPSPRRLRLTRVELPELGKSETPETPSSLTLVSSADVTSIPDDFPDETEPNLSSEGRRLLRRLIERSPDDNPDETGVSRGDVEKLLRWRRSKAAETLKTLSDSGFLRPEGATRSRRYVVTDEGRKAVSR